MNNESLIRTQPCSNCPFRSDISMCLEPHRAQTIIEGIENNGSFHCHKTLKKPQPAICGGAVRWLEQKDILLHNSMLRIAVRLGVLPYPLPDLKIPISSNRWHLAQQWGETDEQTEERCLQELLDNSDMDGVEEEFEYDDVEEEWE